MPRKPQDVSVRGSILHLNRAAGCSTLSELGILPLVLTFIQLLVCEVDTISTCGSSVVLCSDWFAMHWDHNYQAVLFQHFAVRPCCRPRLSPRSQCFQQPTPSTASVSACIHRTHY
jgi:hypothetical protein